MTDVLTSAGVIIGVIATRTTGWHRLDPIIAILVAANIVRSGFRLVQRSVLGLMDAALPIEEIEVVKSVLDRYSARDGIDYHALRTRGAASRRFVSVHILVPGNWTVQCGHDVLEQIEEDLHAKLQRLTVTTHLEPVEDPASSRDVELDRTYRD
jgi:cation diffusion facilitator family transporter